MNPVHACWSCPFLLLRILWRSRVIPSCCGKMTMLIGSLRPPSTIHECASSPVWVCHNMHGLLATTEIRRSIVQMKENKLCWSESRRCRLPWRRSHSRMRTETRLKGLILRINGRRFRIGRSDKLRSRQVQTRIELHRRASVLGTSVYSLLKNAVGKEIE